MILPAKLQLQSFSQPPPQKKGQGGGKQKGREESTPRPMKGLTGSLS
jgi:hypothetical protein